MAPRRHRILMLGWEYPPHISGGLGTACEGLTRSLSKLDVDLMFTMPKLYGDENAPHMHLIDLRGGAEVIRQILESQKTENIRTTLNKTTIEEFIKMGSNSPLFPIPEIPSVYSRPFLDPVAAGLWKTSELMSSQTHVDPGSILLERLEIGHERDAVSGQVYGDQLFEEVLRYIRRTVLHASLLEFDAIHAHDWMTYPAAIAVGRRFGKPVILHVHSIESDRSGQCGNRTISEIEWSALSQATAVIAVSQYTKERVVSDYRIHPDKIFVVHNGVVPRKKIPKPIRKDGKHNVLFLGRVTFQKGPDYFVEAAIKVLKLYPNAVFTLAGSGDMLDSLRNRIRRAGVEKSFKLPGFLRGIEVDRALAEADLYVMPSVSEPFGISALEAMDYEIPVIVSRQSGVSEVVQHALKADFWDVNELADLMIGALRYPELRADLMQMARQELKRLDWDASANRVKQVYEAVI